MKRLLKKWFPWLFKNPAENQAVGKEDYYLNGRRDGVLFFQAVSKRNTTPPNASIKENEFIEVEYKGKPMWALFRCPCGCNVIISLSLQVVHDPHWRLKLSKNKRPTLYPSVWQRAGCRSHFWISDGHVYWTT